MSVKQSFLVPQTLVCGRTEGSQTEVGATKNDSKIPISSEQTSPEILTIPCYYLVQDPRVLSTSFLGHNGD